MGIQINEELLDAARGGEIERLEPLPEGVYPAGSEIPPDRTHIFDVGDRMYTIPTRPNPRVVFRYLRAVRRTGGDEQAMAILLEEVLGEAVFDAMCDEDLDEKQYTQVMKIVERHTLGVMKQTMGN